jgi:hypothetical protein
VQQNGFVNDTAEISVTEIVDSRQNRFVAIRKCDRPPASRLNKPRSSKSAVILLGHVTTTGYE